jgi:hypothetical protein
MFCQCCVGQTEENDKLKSSAALAKNRLVKNLNKHGTWWTFRNFDSVPGNSKRERNIFTGMLIADLIEPLRGDKQIDSVIKRTMSYSYENVNPVNGFLKYQNNERYAEDADDTGLFWYLMNPVDTGFVHDVIDSLEKYKKNEGLYKVWLIKHRNKELNLDKKQIHEIDIIPNIHLYLFFSRFDDERAEKLCKALQSENVIHNPEYWVYYKRAPWLYYLRQVDMIKHNCRLQDKLPGFVRSLSGQEYYDQMARLIRDLSLNKTNQFSDKEIVELLNFLSSNNFEYLQENPMLVYHGVLYYPKPTYYWSHDLPYALWLRLYYEYSEPHAKKK